MVHSSPYFGNRASCSQRRTRHATRTAPSSRTMKSVLRFWSSTSGASRTRWAPRIGVMTGTKRRCQSKSVSNATAHLVAPRHEAVALAAGEHLDPRPGAGLGDPLVEHVRLDAVPLYG